MYQFIKSLLFLLQPETAHHLTLTSLQIAYRLGLLRFIKKAPPHPQKIMGLQFPNAIGLAAGFDKNGDYIEALAALGFGFIEIGTVTPLPQAGNPKPRLFRLPAHEAIINRMGFNNKGVDYVALRLKASSYRGILGINIGKNTTTPLAQAKEDYLICFQKLWRYASYITVNISSPNTEQLRTLQSETLLSELLETLKEAQTNIFQTQQKYVPLVVKIAPDLTHEEIISIANLLLRFKIDGVIATNTTINSQSYTTEKGGLSGKPLHALSLEVVKTLSRVLDSRIPIIASGGIMDAEKAEAHLAAGASLLQLYTGLIYHGPALIQ